MTRWPSPMRWRSLSAALVLVVLLGAGALAQPADDDWIDSLVFARDRLDDDIALLDRELASISERTTADDWRVYIDSDGQVVEIDLRNVDHYVPLALVFARHPDELQRVMREALLQADPAAWSAVVYLSDTGDLEGKTVDEVKAMLRSNWRQDPDDKRARYADWKAKVQAERDGLAQLRTSIQSELDALGRTTDEPPMPSSSPEPSAEPSPVSTPEPSFEPTPEPSLEPSPEPSLEPSPEPSLDPCLADGENAVDILCSDWGEATPEPEDDDIVLPSLPPTEIEELRSPTPIPSLEPQPNPGSTSSPTPVPSSEPTPGMEAEGVQYDALEGLEQCDAGDPGCPAADDEPLVEGDIVCEGAFADALTAPYTSLSADQIGACFDDCQDWISWHGSFGDTLPAWCSGETAGPSEPPDASADSGWCWDDYGQWKLWGEAKGDPLCEGVETP